MAFMAHCLLVNVMNAQPERTKHTKHTYNMIVIYKLQWIGYKYDTILNVTSH